MDLSVAASQPRVFSSMISALKKSSRTGDHHLPTMPKVKAKFRTIVRATMPFLGTRITHKQQPAATAPGGLETTAATASDDCGNRDDGAHRDDVDDRRGDTVCYDGDSDDASDACNTTVTPATAERHVGHHLHGLRGILNHIERHATPLFGQRTFGRHGGGGRAGSSVASISDNDLHAYRSNDDDDNNDKDNSDVKVGVTRKQLAAGAWPSWRASAATPRTNSLATCWAMTAAAGGGDGGGRSSRRGRLAYNDATRGKTALDGAKRAAKT